MRTNVIISSAISINTFVMTLTTSAPFITVFGKGQEEEQKQQPEMRQRDFEVTDLGEEGDALFIIPSVLQYVTYIKKIVRHKSDEDNSSRH